jgi:hypothetical protein
MLPFLVIFFGAGDDSDLHQLTDMEFRVVVIVIMYIRIKLVFVLDMTANGQCHVRHEYSWVLMRYSGVHLVQ